MIDFSKLSDSISFTGKVERSLRQNFAKAVALFAGEGKSKEEKLRWQMMLSMVRGILESSGPLTESDIDSFRRLLSADFSPQQVETAVADMRNAPAAGVEEVAAAFQTVDRTNRERLIRSLLILAVSSGGGENAGKQITDLAERLGLDEARCDAIRSEVEESLVRRARIIRSGAGVLVALIVIGVFILTATLLRSVIFGLIVAYLFLPLEKYFERRLRKGKGVAHHFFRLTDFFSAPLRRLASHLQRNRTERTPAEEAKYLEHKLIARATAATCSFLLLIILLVVMLLSMLTGHYVQNIRTKLQNVRTEQAAANPDIQAEAKEQGFLLAEAGHLIGQGKIWLEQFRERFENLPLVKLGLDQIELVLNDESTQRELAAYLLQRTGGLFSFTAGVIGAIGVLVGDLLLTIFFFLLFLMKLAEFCGPDYGTGRQSEYLVRTVFNGKWLPGASPETVAEAQRIIGGVITRLRVWVRGYLTLLLIDATVYTFFFFLLGVPYFPLLGILAGCGILLPYIGPILSASVTVLVTLAAGSDVSATQLLGIIAIYLVWNGIIEQFITYPMVIGESLGLTTLETIIVVLLGAVLAGIPGMLLALPTASVIKYLVPQIYKCFGELPMLRKHEREK